MPAAFFVLIDVSVYELYSVMHKEQLIWMKTDSQGSEGFYGPKDRKSEFRNGI